MQGAHRRVEPEPQGWSMDTVLTADLGEEAPGRLAQLLGLDVWETSLLARPARLEMEAAAIVLVLVFLFELGAWTTLFHLVLFGFDVGLVSALALVPGAVFSAATLMFERSLVCLDPDTVSPRRAVGVCIRGAVIVGSSLITAQPLELLVFRADIDQHLKDEAVYREAIAELARSSALTVDPPVPGAAVVPGAAEPVGDSPLSIAQARVEERRLALETAKGELRRAKSAADRAAATQSNAAGRLAGLRADPGADVRALAEAEAALAKATTTSAHARRVLEDADRGVQLADAALDEARRGEEVATGKAQEASTAEATRSDTEADEGRDWIRAVAEAAPGEVLEHPRTKRPFQPHVQSMLRRALAMHELITNQPATWPEGTPAEWSGFAVRHFGLPDPAPVAGSPRGAKRAWSYLLSSALLLAVGMVVPLMTLAFKLMMGDELQAYYSCAAQEAAGNLTARAVRRARPVRGSLAAQLYRALGDRVRAALPLSSEPPP